MTTSTKPHPRLSSRLGALSLLTIALVFGASAVPAASTTPQNAAKSHSKALYVALGDSFTSGQGAPDYLDFPPECLRSASASYPIILATRSPYELAANQSCSGADTAEVQDQVADLPLTLKELKSVRLVTLTVGGIDALSNVVLGACFAGDPTGPACQTALIQSSALLQSDLLVTPLAATYVAAATAMPKATIVVFTYPLLFNTGVGGNLGGLVNTATGLLNGNIRDAVALASEQVSGPSDRIQIVDVTEEFSGRGIGATDSWISFDLSNPDPRPNFHPNALGNSSGYYQALVNDRVLR